MKKRSINRFGSAVIAATSMMLGAAGARAGVLVFADVFPDTSVSGVEISYSDYGGGYGVLNASGGLSKITLPGGAVSYPTGTFSLTAFVNESNGAICAADGSLKSSFSVVQASTGTLFSSSQLLLGSANFNPGSSSEFQFLWGSTSGSLASAVPPPVIAIDLFSITALQTGTGNGNASSLVESAPFANAKLFNASVGTGDVFITTPNPRSLSGGIGLLAALGAVGLFRRGRSPRAASAVIG